MNIESWIGIALGFFGLVSILIGAFFIAKSTIHKETIQTQSALIETLQADKQEQNDKIKLLQDSDLQNKTDIAQMQGQIDTLKTIPLKDIAKDMANISTTQQAILEIIAKTPEITNPSQKKWLNT